MRQSRAWWEAAVSEFEAGELTQEAFAKKRGVRVSTFRSWLYGLRREGEVAPALLPVRVVSSPALKARQATASSDHDGEGMVEVVLPSGIQLRFMSGTAASYVAELVAQLTSRC